MLLKNSLLPYALIFSLAALAFTGIFYLVEKPTIETYSGQNQKNTEAPENKTEKDIFNPDLLTWTEATNSAAWSRRDSHATAIFKNKIYLAGGLNGNGYVMRDGSVEYWNTVHFSDVWVSENGKDWELITDKAPWGERRSVQLAVFKDKMWLMGGWGPGVGYKNDVWVTEDGINWTEAAKSAAWPAREGHLLVVFRDKLWLIGGVRYDKRETKNDVWYSEDGINWFEATPNAQWSPRWDHAVTVFDNKLWLIGGMNLNDKIFKDVWNSEDGINWTLVGDNPPWEKRQGNNILEYEGKLWIIGRFNDSINKGENDVWYSEDGINWQKTEKDPAWLGREDFTAVIFEDKIWIFGGMDSNWEWTNDIWYSEIK